MVSVYNILVDLNERMCYNTIKVRLMDLLSEYKELYYKEIEHNERLNSKAAICISFLTIIGGGLILVWTQIEDYYVLLGNQLAKAVALSGVICVLFAGAVFLFAVLVRVHIKTLAPKNIALKTTLLLFFIFAMIIAIAWSALCIIDLGVRIYVQLYFLECWASVICFLICITYFIKTFYGYKVHYFPIREFAVHNQKVYESQPEEKAEAIISERMAQRFINDAIHNRKNNVVKSDRHKVLIIWITVTFISVLITYATNVAIELYKFDELNEQEVIAMADDEIKVRIKAVSSSDLPPIPEPEVFHENFSLKTKGETSQKPKK